MHSWFLLKHVFPLHCTIAFENFSITVNIVCMLVQWYLVSEKGYITSYTFFRRIHACFIATKYTNCLSSTYQHHNQGLTLILNHFITRTVLMEDALIKDLLSTLLIQNTYIPRVRKTQTTLDNFLLSLIKIYKASSLRFHFKRIFHIYISIEAWNYISTSICI